MYISWSQTGSSVIGSFEFLVRHVLPPRLDSTLTWLKRIVYLYWCAIHCWFAIRRMGPLQWQGSRSAAVLWVSWALRPTRHNIVHFGYMIYVIIAAIIRNVQMKQLNEKHGQLCNNTALHIMFRVSASVRLRNVRFERSLTRCWSITCSVIVWKILDQLPDSHRYLNK